ncbi:MAG: antirestriction protein ArdA [Streptococcaceae bacterium]|jgi:hypothetical protein|nr:antirestriction protein ArdA [Streptococcaceae bacterium]
MELKVLLTTSGHAKTGQWFDLPSQEFERRIRWLTENGIEASVVEFMGDIPSPLLAHYKVSELNKIAQGLEDLPDDVIQNLPLFLEYETLDELIESEGEHFIYHEETTMREVAREMVRTGEIEPFIALSDLMNDYVDYGAVAHDLEDLHPYFFQLSSGEIVQYDK